MNAARLIAVLAGFLLCTASTPIRAQECNSKESCANILIEWLNDRRAKLERDPNLFLLHSLVLVAPHRGYDGLP